MSIPAAALTGDASTVTPAVEAALPAAAGRESARGRILAAAACSALVAVPFLVVRFPPVTDLPQHVAQIRLFLEALADPGGAYRIQWFTPYSAAYALLGAAWALAPPADAGRYAVLALGVLWTLAVHALAARRQRSVAAAVLASVLFFNHTLYWGFLSFAVGWLAFVVWLLITTRAPDQGSSAKESVQYCAVAALLYVSHVLWLAAAVLWLLVVSVLHRIPVAMTARRLISIAPVLIAVAIWYPHLAASGFRSETVWAVVPTARLSCGWLARSVLGGLRGPGESLFLLIAAAWAAAGLWQNRAALTARLDWDLLAAALLLFVLALLLPDKYTNTIQFAARWMPAAAILFVLAVPAPITVERLQPALAFAAAAVFCLATAIAWQRFERDELSGLPDVLAALPDGQRVLGLDFVKDSAVIEERPFLQTFAWAQVVHGGTLNFSFAGFAPSLVVFRDRHQRPWTGGLEWFPEWVRASDFRYFDYAIVNGSDPQHRQLAAQTDLLPQTDQGRWRLYRIPPAAR